MRMIRNLFCIPALLRRIVQATLDRGSRSHLFDSSNGRFDVVVENLQRSDSFSPRGFSLYTRVVRSLRDDLETRARRNAEGRIRRARERIFSTELFNSLVPVVINEGVASAFDFG